MSNDPTGPFLPPPDSGLLRVQLRDLINLYGHDAVAREVAYLTPGTVAPSAPARWGDPETSHRAAKTMTDVGRFSSKSRQSKLLALFEMREMTDQGATIHLVGSQATPSAFDGCRRRCSDLRAAGYLYDTGRRRKNTGSDDLSIIWAITETGKLALRRLEETGWSR